MNFSDLNEHLKTEHGIQDSESGSYQCKICSKTFQQFTSLGNHWAAAHKKKCNHCKKSYINYENNGAKEKTKKCNWLGFTGWQLKNGHLRKKSV